MGREEDWNQLLSFHGDSEDLRQQGPLCQQRKEFSDGKTVHETWFIRKGCVWGLQAGRQEMLRPENLPGYKFYNQRKAGRGRRPPFPSFLSRCHASLISSSSSLSRRVFLSLHGPARSANFCFLDVQRACSRDHWLYWVPWTRCGSHATTVLLFGGRSHALSWAFVAKQACLVLWWSKPVLSSYQ